MRSLVKHQLDFNKAKNFYLDNLTCGNILSKEILKEINFDDGLFFTLLPDNANLDQLYKFEEMGILPQNPPHYSSNGGGSWSIIPNVDEEIGHFLSEKGSSLESGCFIFEDVNTDPNYVKKNRTNQSFNHISKKHVLLSGKKRI